MVITPFINAQFLEQTDKDFNDETVRADLPPQTADEIVDYLDKLQSQNKANEFIRTTFDQDPLVSENKLLTETVQQMQSRLHDT